MYRYYSYTTEFIRKRPTANKKWVAKKPAMENKKDEAENGEKKYLLYINI